MNNQEAFNRAKKGLLEQFKTFGNSAQSISHEIQTCLYRGESGKKCAIGHLIDDKDYHPDMEFSTIFDDNGTGKFYGVRVLFKEGAAFADVSQTLLADLQYLHDFKNPEDWESGLDEIQVKLDSGNY